MNARLKVLHEKANVKSIKLLPTTVIGRSLECDLKIASNEVSRIHCRVSVKDDAVYIEDLGSANGTYVNDQALPPRQLTLLQPGDKLAIGPAEFVVDYTAPTSNTVVVRRSDRAATEASAAAPAEVESTSKDLIFSGMPESTDQSSAEATIVVEPAEKYVVRPLEVVAKAAAVVQEQKPPEPEVPAPAVSSPPVTKAVAPAAPVVAPSAGAKPASVQPQPAKPAVVKANAASPQPVKAEAVAKPAVSAPVAPPVAKAVAVAPAIPTAKPVQPPVTPSVPAAEPAQAVPTFPLQFDQPVKSIATPAAPKPSEKPVAKAAAVPPTPQFVPPAPVAAAPEAVESPQDEGLSFDFSSEPTVSSKPSAKPAKGGGLKSIFSAFGRKPGQTPSKSTPAAPEPEPEPEPVSEPPAVVHSAAQETAPAEQFSLGFGAPQAEEGSETAEQPAADDDFQNFLRQF